LKIVETVIDLLFLCDIFIIFNSAFYRHDVELVEDRATIACDYLKGWFVIDFFFFFLIEFLFNLGGLSNMIRITRVGRLAKLIKLTKLLRVLKIMRD